MAATWEHYLLPSQEHYQAAGLEAELRDSMQHPDMAGVLTGILTHCATNLPLMFNLDVSIIASHQMFQFLKDESLKIDKIKQSNYILVTRGREL